MTRTFRYLLWTAIIIALIGLGAKLFDLTVVATAWSASPPESLRLMPYGPNYPMDPGDFFQPIAILITISYLGAFLAGWRSGGSTRTLLILSMIPLLVGGVATPTVFWPMIRELYGAGAGSLQRSQEELTFLIRKWFVLDILRTLLLVVGIVCHLTVLNRRIRASE